MKRFIYLCVLICNTIQAQVPGLLKDIHPGKDSTQFGKFYTMSNNNVLFDVVGSGLWVTDGSTAGTEALKPRNGVNLTGKLFTEYAGKTFFAGSTGGFNLWKTDGTRQGTDSIPTPGAVNITSLLVVNNLLVFFTYGGSGTLLWRSDGTIAGTYTIASFTASEEAYEVVNNILYFKGHSVSAGYELWRTDGTVAGTFLLKDINPGASTSLGVSGFNPILGASGNTVFFSANDGTNGLELWKTDGSAANTILVKDITSGSTSTYLNRNSFWTGGNGIYFMANNQVNGNELWFSDGTVAGTQMLRDAATGTASAEPQKLTFIGNYAYYFYLDYNNFNTQTLSSQRILFKSDGTPAGTSSLAVAPAYNATTLVIFSDVGFHTYNNALYFSMRRIDNLPGTTKDTILLYKTDLNLTSYSVVAKLPVDSSAAGGVIFYFPRLTTLQGNRLLYVYMGVNNNGLTLATFNLLTGSGKTLHKLGPSTPYNNQNFTFYTAGNKVYFPFPPNNDMEPGYIDLITDSVYQLKNINPNGAAFGCYNFSSLNVDHVLYKLNNKYYFLAYEPGYGFEFFETDFTSAGTYRIKDIHPGPNSFDRNNWQNSCYSKLIHVTPNNIYFGANDGVSGFELWSFINAPNNPVQVPINFVTDTQIVLYPNPANYSVFIRSGEGFTSSDRIQVVDMLGKPVKNISGIEGKEIEIGLTELSNGLYFLKTEGADKKSHTCKLIVAH